MITIKVPSLSRGPYSETLASPSRFGAKPPSRRGDGEWSMDIASRMSDRIQFYSLPRSRRLTAASRLFKEGGIFKEPNGSSCNDNVQHQTEPSILSPPPPPHSRFSSILYEKALIENIENITKVIGTSFFASIVHVYAIYTRIFRFPNSCALTHAFPARPNVSKTPRQSNDISIGFDRFEIVRF